MNGLINSVGSALLSNGIQFLVGLVLSLPIYSMKNRMRSVGRADSFAFAALAAIAGILLPIEVYGIIPIVIALLAKGLEVTVVLPLFFSNTIFHSMDVFCDPWFVWRTGLMNMLLAFSTALLLAVLIKQMKLTKADLIADRFSQCLHRPDKSPFRLSGTMHLFRAAILFMSIGVSLNVLFNDVILWRILTLFYRNEHTARIPLFFSSADVDMPLILFTTTIARMLMNLTTLSGVVFLFKAKGCLCFLTYYAGLAFLFMLFSFLI